MSSITTLRNDGVATAVAAGNEGSKNGISSPACVSTAISVGSWNASTDSVSSFSNSASILTLLAPGARSGGGIRSSVPSSAPPYSTYVGMEGTSMAAPHVAGAFAALHQLHPADTVSQLLSLLTSTGTGVTDPGNSISKPRIRLDLALASSAAVPGAPTSVTGAAVDSQATVSWVPPLSGGSPITSYTATVSPGGQTCLWTSGPLGCTITGLANNTPYTFSVHASNVVGDGPESASSGAVTPATPYVPIVPARYLDTRTPAQGGATFDNTNVGGGPLLPGETRTLQIAGRQGGVPVPATGVGAVALNVTVVAPSGGGYVTVFPAGSAPNASNLNFSPGQVVPNMVIAQVAPDGTIKIKNGASGNTPIIVDVVGWFPAATPYMPIVPARYLDTRTPAQGGATFDNTNVGGGPLLPGETRTLQIAGRQGGVPVPATGVGAVALNVTVVAPSGGGYVTVFPAGSAPNASNLNFSPGQVVPNMVIAQVAPDGTIKIKNGASGNTPIIVDVAGWFPSGGGVNPLVPARIMDTRSAIEGGATVDGKALATGPIAAGATTLLQVVGRGGVPAVGASAVAVNVTVVGPSGGGYLSVFPSGVVVPNASNLNFSPGPGGAEHGDRPGRRGREDRHQERRQRRHADHRRRGGLVPLIEG